jgi:UDP-glucose 4-epimerase
MNAMYSIVAHPQTPASVPKFQVLCSKILKNGVDDKLRIYNLGNGSGYSVMDVVQAAREITAIQFRFAKRHGALEIRLF